MPFGGSWSVDRLFALKRQISQKSDYAIPVNDVASSMRLVNRGSITAIFIFFHITGDLRESYSA